MEVLDAQDVLGGLLLTAHLVQAPGKGFEVLGRGRPAGVAGPAVDGGRDPRTSYEVDEGLGQLFRWDGERGLHDLVAEVGAETGGVVGGGYAIGVDGAAGGAVGGESDAQVSGVGADFFQEGSLRGRGPVGIAQVGTGRGVEEGGAVADGAGEGVLDYQTAPVFAEIGAQGVAGPRGLEAEQAATGGRDADGATTVAALGHRYNARGHGGRGAPAGAARRAVRVPGVVGGAEEAWLGSGKEAELRGVGLSENDEAGALVPRDELRIVVSDVLAQEARSFLD